MQYSDVQFVHRNAIKLFIDMYDHWASCLRTKLYAIMLMYLRKGYASGNSKLRGKKLSKMRNSTAAVAPRWLVPNKDCQGVI